MRNNALVIFLLVASALHAQGLAIGASTTFTLGSATLSLSGNWNNAGTFTAGSGTVVFSSPNGNQTITKDGGETFNNLTINKAADDVVLNDNITVDGTLTCTSGDLDLNGKIISLGASASLSESAGATVKGSTGYLTATRNLNAPAAENVAGLGAVLTSAANLGNTVINRHHAVQSIDGNNSILRYYDITPTTNTGLNATLVYHYDDSELNGSVEHDLQLYKSTDNGVTWSTLVETLNTVANTLTVSGLDGFSRFTATDFNTPPTGADNSVTTNEDTDKTFASGDFTFNDIDPDVFSGIQVTVLESKGTLKYDGADVTVNLACPDVTKLVYSPVANEHGNNYATFKFKVYDGTDYSTSDYTMTIHVTSVNDAPVLAAIEGAPLNYSEGTAAETSTTISITDDEVNLEGAVIRITGNYQNDQDILLFTNQNGITGTWTNATGTMTLSGTSSAANYQTAIRSVKYDNTSDTPNTLQRTVTFIVSDGDLNSNSLTRQINVTAINDAPVLAGIEGNALFYYPGNPATQITASITVSDPDDANIESGIVTIGNYVNGQDELLFTNQNGITGVWNAALGTLTLTGTTTPGNYQTALRSILYNNTSQSPNLGTRIISFTLNDGDINSQVASRNINLQGEFNPPTVAVNTGGTVKEGGHFIFHDTFLRAGDPNGSTYSITFTLIEEPKFGTLNLNGASLSMGGLFTFTQNDIANSKLIYYHNGEESETDTIAFRLSDEDGDSSEINYFVFTIEGVNDSPVVSVIPTMIMNEDETKIILFEYFRTYVNDPDNDFNTLSLTLSAASPNAEISVVNNSFKIVCVENWYGTAILNLEISDGEFSVNTDFLLTVQPVNDPPVITGLPVSFEFIQTQTATINFTGTAHDIETPDSLLVFSFSAEPDSLITSFNNSTKILTLASMGGFRGNVELKVIVTDQDDGRAEEIISVNVNLDPTGIERVDGIPADYSLFNNYPNPFNPTTKIRFGLPETAQVTLIIYDVLGREVETLINSEQHAGYYEYNWNAVNFSSGIYFFVLTSQSQNKSIREIRKMLLIK